MKLITINIKYFREKDQDEPQQPSLANSEQQVSKMLRVCFEVVETLEPCRKELTKTYPIQSCDCSCQSVH